IPSQYQRLISKPPLFRDISKQRVANEMQTERPAPKRAVMSDVTDPGKAIKPLVIVMPDHVCSYPFTGVLWSSCGRSIALTASRPTRWRVTSRHRNQRYVAPSL